MLLFLLRICFASLMVGVATFAFSFFLVEAESLTGAFISGLIVLGLGSIVLYTDMRDKEKHIANISSVFFGLVIGLIVGWLFAVGMDAVLDPLGISIQLEGPKLGKLRVILRVLITLIACYVAVSTIMQTRDEFRFVIPYVEFSKQIKGGRPLVLDTSVIIDGRIADLCETRIIDSRLIVPKFVLQELQGIADSSDKLKRNRGRRGLDILKRMQSNPKVDLQMHDGNTGELRPVEKMRVDERLLVFTKVIGGRIVTNDFNLNKLAQLQSVEVINLNEVANVLKTVTLPGESLSIKIVRLGDQIGQGVGYLEDGTMVVVENGRNLIGTETMIVVTSVLQTPAGRMIFGRPDSRSSGSYSPPASGTHQPVPPVATSTFPAHSANPTTEATKPEPPKV